jgi:DNA-binding NtrC family response regulator
LADGGTILLDEITEIDLPLQAKLLRVLPTVVWQVSSGVAAADVRVVATTSRDLQAEVAGDAGRIYFQWQCCRLRAAARERLEDVPQLVEHFMGVAAERLGREPCELSRDALDLLGNYHWPGNVRELENLITRASVLSAGRRVAAGDLKPWLMDSGGIEPQRELVSEDAAPSTTAGTRLEDMERRLIEATLEHFGHRAAAQALGIGVRTLMNKLRQYGYAPRARSFGKAA